ncbi:MAG: nicotinate-nucleotide adenylyltransferase [Nitrosomonas sp.]|nr:nicotinate-nucleotide adenylyltransferase [Nitrosomonas sp.]MDP1950306.1 nicotinate-nucleotide adenylyltransferase [Nitrosomonas sp.]
MSLSLVGIYGGTFDPVHYGHLRIAEELNEAIGFHELRFLPSGSPCLRNAPGASRIHRVDMLQAAIQDNNKFILDAREINRADESYSVISLRELRHEIGENSALCFIMGADVFLKLAEWYCWHEIFELCHIVIVDRPGYLSIKNNYNLSPELKENFFSRQVGEVNELKNLASGLIYVAATTLLDISATTIRAKILAGKSTRYLMPDVVLEYIKSNHLYSGIE